MKYIYLVVFSCIYLWSCHQASSNESKGDSTPTDEATSILNHVNKVRNQLQNQTPERGLTYKVRDYEFRTEAYRDENNAMLMMVNNGLPISKGETDIYMFFRHGVPYILYTEQSNPLIGKPYFLQEYALFKDNKLNEIVKKRQGASKADMEAAPWIEETRASVNGEMLEQNMRQSLQAKGAFQLYFDRIIALGNKEQILFTSSKENKPNSYTTYLQIGEVEDESLKKLRQTPENYHLKAMEVTYDYINDGKGGIIAVYKGGKLENE